MISEYWTDLEKKMTTSQVTKASATFLTMVTRAIRENRVRRAGVSSQAICAFIADQYPDRTEVARHVRTTLAKGVESGKFVKCKMSYRLSPSWSKASKAPKKANKTSKASKVDGLKVSPDGQAEAKAVVGHHLTFYPIKGGNGGCINPPIELTLEEYARRMRKARKLDATRTDGKSKVKTLLKRVAWSFDIKFVGGRVERRVADHDCHCEELISHYLSKLPVPVNTTYLFCRVSTKAQASETSTSLASQAQTLFKAGYVLAQADDVAVRRIKTLSVCSSAYSTISSRLVDIGAASRRGDCILVQSIDRLTRSCEHFRPWAAEVHGKGVIVYSVLDRLAYSPSDSTFMAKVMLAENHSRVTSEKVKRSVAYRKARGDAIGRAPYGKAYATINGRKVLIEHQDEMALVRTIDGLSDIRTSTNQTIADELNAQGMLKRGKRWTASAVSRVKRLLAPREAKVSRVAVEPMEPTESSGTESVEAEEFLCTSRDGHY